MSTQTNIRPEGWTKAAIKDVAIVNALTVDKKYPYDEIEYIDIASVDVGRIKATQTLSLRDAPSRAKRIVRDQDILISTVRPNLRHYCYVKSAKNNTIASTGFAVVSATKADPYFLYCLLTTDSYTEYLTRIAEGHTSAYPSFNPEVIENSSLLLPPLMEQRAIAAVLSSLDDKIELLRRQNETLEKIAQAIFGEWFVEFNFPDKDGKPYKASGGKMVNSELGPIPEGWIVGNLSDLVDHLTNTVSPSQSPSGEFWHYSIPAYDDNRTPAREKGRAILSNKFLVPEQVVLVSKLNPKTPRIWLVLDPETNSICSSEFQVIRPKQGRHLPFVYLLLRSEDVTRKLAAKAQGTSSSHQRIRPDDILDIKLPIPDSHILELSNSDVEPILRKMDRNLQQTWSLMALRDALLPKLMSGELRVGKFS